MINDELRNRITALIKREVVPAIGCTEPAAVAFAVATARDLLGCIPEKISLDLSGNMLKNAMGVGIPGTGMIGLPIAVALGAIIGKAERGLEVLENVDKNAVEAGKRYIAENCIEIGVREKAPSKLWIDCNVVGDDHSARVVISKSHTNIVRTEVDGKILSDNPDISDSIEQDNDVKLKMSMVWQYATESPIDELRFILEAKRLNKLAAEKALSGDFGHSLGSTISSKGAFYLGNRHLEHMLTYTSAACDARMGGAMIAVMSNSGSGNQGITATMPVVTFAEDTGATEEQTIRALVLSHLTSIYIKQSLGRLSALCGCVVASTGAASGITYLMGGKLPEVCASVKNMVATLTGMICDGAKPSCSMKIASGVATAMLSAMLSVNGKCVTAAEGIIAEDVDQTISNLTSIGREAMRETDRLVLSIMTSK